MAQLTEKQRKLLEEAWRRSRNAGRRAPMRTVLTIACSAFGVWRMAIGYFLPERAAR